MSTHGDGNSLDLSVLEDFIKHEKGTRDWK